MSALLVRCDDEGWLSLFLQTFKSAQTSIIKLAWPQASPDSFRAWEYLNKHTATGKSSH